MRPSCFRVLSAQVRSARSASGRSSAIAALQNCYTTIQEKAHLNAFITAGDNEAHRALATAQAVASDLRPASLGELDGALIAVKDNFCMMGSRTTCRYSPSKSPPFPATVFRRILMGKLWCLTHGGGFPRFFFCFKVARKCSTASCPVTQPR